MSQQPKPKVRGTVMYPGSVCESNDSTEVRVKLHGKNPE